MANKPLAQGAEAAKTDDGVASKITQYLSTPSPSYAFLLFGEWGTGKSFYWRHYRNTRFPPGRHDITFSVAGLMTLEELERALFMASIKDLGSSLLRETGTVVGRAALRLINVDPDDIKLKADVRPGKTVICIDDLERFGGNFRILFGFIVSLLDDANLHVVLIADEERALKHLDDYATYKERIISRSVATPPALRAFYKDVVSGYADQKVREALLARQADLVQFFEEKKLKNLRTLRGILDELNALLSAIEWPDGRTPALDSLVTAVTFSAIAQSKNAANRGLVRQAFLQEDLGMGLALFRMDKDDASKGKEVRPLPKLINEIGFENEANGWSLARNFAAYVAGDPFDPKAIAAEFSIFEVDHQQVGLLDRFRNFQSMEDGQFQEALAELRRAADERSLGSVQEIWTAFQLLYHLSQLRLSGLKPDECVQLFLDVIADHERSLDVQPGLDIWPGDIDAGAGKVVTALEQLESNLEARQRANAEDVLREYLFTGAGEDPREIQLVPLADQDAGQIYGRLKTAGRDAALRFDKFYRRRLQVSNIAQFAWREATVAMEVAALIENDVGGLPVFNLDQSALHLLATVLRQYAKAVEGGRPAHDSGNDGVAGNQESDGQDGEVPC